MVPSRRNGGDADQMIREVDRRKGVDAIGKFPGSKGYDDPPPATLSLQGQVPPHRPHTFAHFKRHPMRVPAPDPMNFFFGGGASLRILRTVIQQAPGLLDPPIEAPANSRWIQRFGPGSFDLISLGG